jgi:hypothetical protein
MLKITKVNDQYVLNINLGAVTVFETVEIHSGIMLVLKREDRRFDNKGNVSSQQVGVQTLMGDPMIEALEQMHELSIKVINKRVKDNV